MVDDYGEMVSSRGEPKKLIVREKSAKEKTSNLSTINIT
jgi:hypothetical protein